MTDALRGSQSFRMNGQFFRERPAGGTTLKHTFCAALPAPQNESRETPLCLPIEMDAKVLSNANECEGLFRPVES